MKLYFTFILCTIPFLLNAQNLTTLRVGAIYQNSLGTEIGVSRIYLIDQGFLGAAAGFYGSGEINFHREHQPVYGLKIGGETCWGIFYGAAELKYMVDNSANVLILTPKAGLSIYSFLTLAYGYNIKEDKAFTQISPHQFSLTVNVSKKAFELWR